MFEYIPNMIKGLTHSFLGCKAKLTLYHMAAKVSLERISEFLRDTELLDEFDEAEKLNQDVETLRSGPEDPDVIGFSHASFAWAKIDGSTTPSRNFTLSIDDQLIFKRGSLNLIIGPTGSGKTSLLMALLGGRPLEPILDCMLT